MNKKLIILSLFIICFLMAGVSAASDNASGLKKVEKTDSILTESYNVSGNTFKNISDALDSANPGDTIILKGKYTNNDSGEITINTGNLTIIGRDNCTLDAQTKSRIFTVNASGVTISGINFINGKSTANGGAIDWRGVNGTLYGCSFINNTANSGGALYWYRSDYGRVENCSFINNTAYSNGALYWLNSAYGCVVNSSFTANRITSNYYNSGGGAVCWLNSADGRLDKCIFSANTAPNSGAVFWSGSARARIGNCTFTSNTAKQNGGVITLVCEGGYIDNCTFRDNSAGVGGAVYWGSGAGNTIVNCTFAGNSADSNGGAVFWSSGGDNSIVNCTFAGNSALRGGGLYWSNGYNNNYLTDCTFRANNADEGSAVFAYGCFCVAGNCNFEDNTNRSTIYLNPPSYTVYSFSLINCSEINNMQCDYFIFNDGWNLYLFNNTLIHPIYNNGNITSKTNITCLNNTTHYAYNEVINLDAVIRDDNNNIIMMELFTFNLNNTKSVKVFFNKEGHANIYYALKDYGRYLINCTDYSNVLNDNTVYTGIIDYRPQEKTTILINISDVENITFKLADDINTTLKVIINGVNYDVDVSKGFGNLSLNNISRDVVYYITACYIGSDKYGLCDNSTSFIVYKYSTPMDVSDVAIYVGEDAVINISNLPYSLSGENLKVHISGTENNYTAFVNSNGYASCNISDLSYGRYYITVTFEGNDLYAANTTVCQVTVNKRNIELILNDIAGNLIAGVPSNLTVKFNETITGEVIFNINGINYTVDVDNADSAGYVYTPPGSAALNLYASFRGNDMFNANVSNIRQFNVSDVYSISISNGVTLYYLDGTTVTARLVDAGGAAVSGAFVTFKLDGKVTAVNTDSNGYARLTLNPAPGRHSVSASFNGSTASAVIVVKSLLSAKKTTSVKKSASVTAIKITVKGKTSKVKFTYKGKNSISVSFGNTWKNQKVLVSFKGKTYQVKVNSNGKGTLKLNKADVRKLKKNKKYTASVYKSYTGKVKVNFNGKNYSVKISKGACDFKVTKKMVKNLKKGKTVKYTVSYNADKITRYVKIK